VAVRTQPRCFFLEQLLDLLLLMLGYGPFLLVHLLHVFVIIHVLALLLFCRVRLAVNLIFWKLIVELLLEVGDLH